MKKRNTEDIVMQAFVSVLLTLFTTLATFFGIFIMPAAPKDIEDDFVPVMRFVAASDTHVITLGDTGCRRITKMMKQAYALAEQDADYNTVDAVVVAGDLTDDGTMFAYAAYAKTFESVLRDETQLLSLAAVDSHDGNTYSKADSLGMFTQVTGQEPDYHTVIGGFHFIVVSACVDEDKHYTEEQIEWLDEQLSIAVADTPDKPVFVFQHEHITDTVFGSYTYEGWGVKYFTEVLNKYPQVVDISGHSHYPSNDPRSIWQGTFTAIGDCGLSYAEFSVDGVNSIHPDGCKTVAQALILEVDADNRVLVKVLDITAGEILCTYLVDNVTDAVKTKYSHDERRAAANAPVFADDAAITYKKGVINATVTVPQATVEDGNEIYIYRIAVKNEAGETLYAAWEFSEYYFADRPDSISFKFSMPDGAAYAEVVAEDVWGNQSEALTIAF